MGVGEDGGQPTTSLMQTGPEHWRNIRLLPLLQYWCPPPDAEEVAQWRGNIFGAGWEICPLGRYLPGMDWMKRPINKPCRIKPIYCRCLDLVCHPPFYALLFKGQQ